MFILYAVVAGVVAGLLLGGDVDGLGRLSFRWVWAALIGLAVQVVLFSDAGSRAAGASGPAVYVASTALVLAFVVRNARLTGMPIVALGAAANLVAILANGGTMPASRGALEVAGRIGAGGFSNSRELAAPVLAPLGDVFALPSWMPLANVFSIGDVLIGLGVLVLIAAAMRRPALRATVARPAFETAGAGGPGADAGLTSRPASSPPTGPDIPAADTRAADTRAADIPASDIRAADTPAPETSALDGPASASAVPDGTGTSG